MKYQVFMTDTAKSDLREIALYLYDQSGDAEIAASFVLELQFTGFLFESDGTDGRAELAFISDHFGTYMTISQFLNFKYGKCMDEGFINTPPRCLLYIVKNDLTAGSVKASNGRPVSKEIVDLFKEVGTAFIALNGESVTEIANLSNYSLMLDDFLKQYGLYFTDMKGGIRNNPKSMDLRGNKNANWLCDSINYRTQYGNKR